MLVGAIFFVISVVANRFDCANQLVERQCSAMQPCPLQRHSFLYLEGLCCCILLDTTLSQVPLHAPTGHDAAGSRATSKVSIFQAGQPGYGREAGTIVR